MEYTRRRRSEHLQVLRLNRSTHLKGLRSTWCRNRTFSSTKGLITMKAKKIPATNSSCPCPKLTTSNRLKQLATTHSTTKSQSSSCGRDSTCPKFQSSPLSFLSRNRILYCRKFKARGRYLGTSRRIFLRISG